MRTSHYKTRYSAMISFRTPRIQFIVKHLMKYHRKHFASHVIVDNYCSLTIIVGNFGGSGSSFHDFSHINEKTQMFTENVLKMTSTKPIVTSPFGLGVDNLGLKRKDTSILSFLL